MFWVFTEKHGNSGSGVHGSAPPLAAEAASLIENRLSVTEPHTRGLGFCLTKKPEFGNILRSTGSSTASPFYKGGLRGIFLIHTGVIENLRLKEVLDAF